jgi:hypothetical protein
MKAIIGKKAFTSAVVEDSEVIADSLSETRARLFAASNDLLAALETLAAYANGRLGKNPYSIPEYEQALRAIGKAKGLPCEGNAWMDANNPADILENRRRNGE